MISRNDLIEIDNARRKGEGFSIESDYDIHDYVGDEFKRLADALIKWSDEHNLEWLDSPLHNSGIHFANDVFVASAYDWSDEPIDLNFYHFASNCDISWYKHAWRGTYGHSIETAEAISDGTFSDIIDECIASLDNTKENELDWSFES